MRTEARQRIGVRALLPLAAVLLIGGCVTVGKSVLMDRSATPVPEARVYVFLPSDSIAPSCERVAILNAQGSTDFTNESQMIDKMREEAGKLGANAILLQSIEDPGGAERFASAIFGTEADRDGEGLSTRELMDIAERAGISTRAVTRALAEARPESGPAPLEVRREVSRLSVQQRLYVDGRLDDASVERLWDVAALEHCGAGSVSATANTRVWTPKERGGRGFEIVCVRTARATDIWVRAFAAPPGGWVAGVVLAGLLAGLRHPVPLALLGLWGLGVVWAYARAMARARRVLARVEAEIASPPGA